MLINLVSVQGKSKNGCSVGTGYVSGSWIFTHCDNVSNGRFIYPTANIFNERISSPLVANTILYCSNMKIVMLKFTDGNGYQRPPNNFEFEDVYTVNCGDELTAVGYQERGSAIVKTYIRNMNNWSSESLSTTSIQDLNHGWFFSLGNDIPPGMLLHNNSGRFVGWSIGDSRAIHATRFMDCVNTMKSIHKSTNEPEYMWYQFASFVWSAGNRNILEQLGYDPSKRGVVINDVFHGSLIPKKGHLLEVIISSGQENSSSIAFKLLRSGIAYYDLEKRPLSLCEIMSLVKEGDKVVFRYSVGDITVNAASTTDKTSMMVPTRLLIKDIVTSDLSLATLDDVIQSTGGRYSALNKHNLYKEFVFFGGCIHHMIDNVRLTDSILSTFRKDKMYTIRSIFEKSSSVYIDSYNRCTRPSKTNNDSNNIVITSEK